VSGEVVGSIEEPGLCVLIGVSTADAAASAEALARRLWNLRILQDESGRMNCSCSDLGAPLLVISQFTLYADATRGRRPSFGDAMAGPEAEPLVDRVVEELRRFGARVSTGRFGAEMAVELVNDGPVTILLDT
jgi:D-tyrosyl-tRNA(Tyr) deacylase